MSAADIGTWVSVGVGVLGFGLTIVLLWKTRGDVQRALGRFRRVGTAADVGNAIKMIDEMRELLQQDSFERALMRAGDLRVLIPQIQEVAPGQSPDFLWEVARDVRLVHDVLAALVDGDRGRYDAAHVRGQLSEIRAAMEDLQAQSRAAAGGQ